MDIWSDFFAFLGYYQHRVKTDSNITSRNGEKWNTYITCRKHEHMHSVLDRALRCFSQYLHPPSLGVTTPSSPVPIGTTVAFTTHTFSSSSFSTCCISNFHWLPCLSPPLSSDVYLLPLRQAITNLSESGGPTGSWLASLNVSSIFTLSHDENLCAVFQSSLCYVFPMSAIMSADVCQYIQYRGFILPWYPLCFLLHAEFQLSDAFTSHSGVKIQSSTDAVRMS